MTETFVEVVRSLGSEAVGVAYLYVVLDAVVPLVIFGAVAFGVRALWKYQTKDEK